MQAEEEEAIERIRRMCDYPMAEGARIRIMPDVHSGKGCTIGTTMTNVVGADIGCGIYTVNPGKADIDFQKADEAAHFIPSGMNVWSKFCSNGLWAWRTGYCLIEYKGIGRKPYTG